MTDRFERLRESIPAFLLGTSLLAGTAAVAGSFAVAGLTDAFPFTPVSSFVVDTTPAVIVNTVLAVFGEFGQLMQIAAALALTVGLFAVAVGIGMELGRVTVGKPLGALGFVGLLALALTGAPLAALGSALPAALVVFLAYRRANDPLSVADARPNPARRRFLETSFGVAGFVGAGYIAGHARSPAQEMPFLGGGSRPPADVERLLIEADEKGFELPGAPNLVSQIGEFYTIDINTVTPQVDAEAWSFEATGAVGSELSVSYDDLREMPTETRFTTLRCVGEDINDREMDNAVWTTTPASAIVEEAEATGDYAVVYAEDGFWNTIPREAFENSYLAYGMNGRVLPREHGHPVRLLVPGRWGETNVKWLDRVEFTDEDVDGYWEERGWDGTGEVSAVAKLWTVEQSEDSVLVGGHAYDGVDGISAVELSLDGGETWTETDVTESLSTDDGWRQWRYEFPAEAGDYDLVVRAIDGNGEIQEAEPTDAFPDGATGWVSRTITVS
jgi:DMSO/TMAO reductase YedYZ molybdopterin-dependent catalytic subunit